MRLPRTEKREKLMPKYVPLNVKEHGSKRWRKVPSFAFAAGQSVVPVLLEELPHVIPTMPLAFLQNPAESASSRYDLVAVLSATPGVNLYITPDGRWLGGYRPAAFRGHPFRLLKDNAAEPRHILCFDEESGLLTEPNEPDSQPFFVEDGKPAPGVEKVLQFLKLQEQGRAATQHAVDLLAQHALVEPWTLNIKNPQGESVPVSGLFRINEAALKALDAQALKALQDGNALSLAYAQLYSQHRLSSFTRLYDLRQKLKESDQAKKDSQVEDLSVEALFGHTDDDIIRFNS